MYVEEVTEEFLLQFRYFTIWIFCRDLHLRIEIIFCACLCLREGIMNVVSTKVIEPITLHHTRKHQFENKMNGRNTSQDTRQCCHYSSHHKCRNILVIYQLFLKYFSKKREDITYIFLCPWKPEFYLLSWSSRFSQNIRFCLKLTSSWVIKVICQLFNVL